MPQMAAMAGSSEMLEQTTQTLNLLGGVYEQVSHIVAFHRGPSKAEE